MRCIDEAAATESRDRQTAKFNKLNKTTETLIAA